MSETIKYVVQVDGMEFATERTPFNDTHQEVADAASDLLRTYEVRYDAKVVVYQLDQYGNRWTKWHREMNGTVIGTPMK